MANVSQVDVDRGDDGPPRRDRTRRATTWVAVDRNGDGQLSTLARLVVVVVVGLASWLVDWAIPDFSPRPTVEASTLLWYAVGAASIGLFRAVLGPDVHGRVRLGWNGVTLALATAWTLTALEAVLRA